MIGSYREPISTSTTYSMWGPSTTKSLSIWRSWFFSTSVTTELPFKPFSNLQIQILSSTEMWNCCTNSLPNLTAANLSGWGGFHLSFELFPLSLCLSTIALQQLHFTCVAYLWYICSTNNDRNACQSTSTSLLHATTIFYLKVGLDLSPHYRTSLELYRKQNPGTHIGQPGRWTRKILFNIVFVFVVLHILAFLQLWFAQVVRKWFHIHLS